MLVELWIPYSDLNPPSINTSHDQKLLLLMLLDRSETDPRLSTKRSDEAMQLDCAHHAEAQDAAELDECEGGELTDTTRGLKLSRVPWFAAWLRGEEAETD